MSCTQGRSHLLSCLRTAKKNRVWSVCKSELVSCYHFPLCWWHISSNSGADQVVGGGLFFARQSSQLAVSRQESVNAWSRRNQRMIFSGAEEDSTPKTFLLLLVFLLLQLLYLHSCKSQQSLIGYDIAIAFWPARQKKHNILLCCNKVKFMQILFYMVLNCVSVIESVLF